MAVKALNDSTGPNGLVLTLLVFGAFPRMSDSDVPAPSIQQRAVAIRKAMEEITKERSQVNVECRDWSWILISRAVCHVYGLLGQSHRELPVFGPIFHSLFPILGLA